MTIKPAIAISMGDPAGVGPEVIVKALSESSLFGICHPFVVGVLWAIDDAIKLLGYNLQTRSIETPAESRGQLGLIDVIDLGSIEREEVVIGQVSAKCGKAAMGFIDRAAHFAMTGEVDGIVTAPINKEAIHEAGFHNDIGHQEVLARITGSTQIATMLITSGLRVVHLSTHKPLIEAAKHVTKANILDKLKLTDQSLKDWGVKSPSIAVAALNPHGGENGLLGKEEIEEIKPAIADARALGIDARGPFPADSVFYRAIKGEFDVVFALYHDQGHVAVKVHNFEDSVTVNLGLPFIRTSVDHGTAFDIAGQGVVNHVSMVRAIETAAQLVSKELGNLSS